MGFEKIRISLDICHWNCCPNPKGPFRFWHQSPNKGRKVLFFFHIVADSESCCDRHNAVRPKSTCLTKFCNSSCSCLYESVHWLLKPCLLMSCGEHTQACAWWLCRNSRGFCHLSNFRHRDLNVPLQKCAKIVKDQSLPCIWNAKWPWLNSR